MYDMADKVDGAKQPKLYETLTGAGREFANGNYDKGQRLLENNGFWNDEVRGVASEANQAGREQAGAGVFGFNEAKAAINGYAKNLESLGTQQDVRGAMEIDSMLRGMDRPGQAGIDGIDDSLKYIEGLLQTKTHLEQQMTPAMKKQWEEQRAVRDALVAEKGKRTEQMKQVQQGGERLTGDRNSARRVLENLYNNAGVPEETSSRQELARRVGRMSAEELYFLNAELRKIAGEFGRTQDQKSLDGLLMDLSSKSFKPEDARKRQKEKDERELEQIRAQLNPEKAAPAANKTPEQEGRSENSKYEKVTEENFEEYRRQNKELVFGGNTWRVDDILSNGNIILHRDITIKAAVDLAERVNRGEDFGGGSLNDGNVKDKAMSVSLEGLKSGGQWIVDKPPRSPQNSDRQKEVEEVKALQQRLVSMKHNKFGEYDLLLDVFEKNAKRLNQERQDYERSDGGR